MKLLLSFAALLIANYALAYDYSIDDFSTHTDYYIAYNNGSGSVTPSTNNSEFVAGNSSLQLNYSFNSGSGSFFSVLKNYGTTTKDWGGQILGYYLTIKGGNENTSAKVRIWEDHNNDGIFNGHDEVFSSASFDVNSTTFKEQKVLQMTFTKTTGNGNGIIDYNRVRAWDIAVENKSTNAQSGTIYIDELKLVNTYSAPTSGTAKLNGSFIQLWNTVGCKCGQFTVEQWKTEFQKMKDACLDKVFVQYGVYKDFSWYTPSNLSYVHTEYNALNRMFEAAEEVGIKIHTGIYFDEEWNTFNKSSAWTYTTLLSKQKETIDELWGLFGNSSAFGGWYIPQEINDLEWQETTQKNLLFSYVSEVASYAKGKDLSKPIAIAPFFNLWMTSDQLASWYGELFAYATALDQVYFQDGVGITLKDPEFHLPMYYKSLKAVCDQYNVAFNVTAESFQQLTGWPIDGGGFSATSSNIERLKKQLWAAEKYSANDIIQFSWSYMQPNNTTESTQLYDDYKTYSCNSTSRNKFNGVTFKVYPNPATATITFSATPSLVKFYSPNGTVITEVENVNSIDISSYSSGIYSLEARFNNDILYRKIAIIK